MRDYQIGSFFKAVTGRDVSEFNDISEIEDEVSKAVGHELPVEFYQSSLISPRGSVFPFSNDCSQIDTQIDKSFF